MKTYVGLSLKNPKKSKVCRLCLELISQGPIYSTVCERIAEMIRFVIGIETDADDGLTKNVCNECYNILKDYEKFKKNCHASETCLRKWHENNKSPNIKQTAFNKRELCLSNYLVSDATLLTSANALPEMPEESVGNSATGADENSDARFKIMPSNDAQVVRICMDVNNQSRIDESEPRSVTFGDESFVFNVNNAGPAFSALKNLTTVDAFSISLPLVSCNDKYCSSVENRKMELDREQNQNVKTGESVIKREEESIIAATSKKEVYDERNFKAAVDNISTKDQLSSPANNDSKAHGIASTLRAHPLLHCEKKYAAGPASEKFVCGMTSPSSTALQHHAIQHAAESSSSVVTAASVKKHIYNCPKCGKLFNDILVFDSHYALHAESKTYSCTTCAVPFTNIVFLKQHIAQKNCTACKKSFPDSSEVHLTVEKKQIRYQCQTCGKFFSTRSSLNRHAVLHTGEKKYSCAICGKKFNQSAVLRRHTFTHDGVEKPFTCVECNKSFTQKQYLRDHICRDHLNIHPTFNCKSCDKKFNHFSGLSRHNATEHKTTINIFVCSKCDGESFKDVSSFRRHVQRFHKETT